MKTIVGFLSREHGLDVLKYLINSKDYKIIKLYTHSLNPKSQDPSRGERKEFQIYKKCCKENKIPLQVIDNKNDKVPNCPKCDFIVEVSWRYLIPSEITKKAKIAALGLHRGKLPEYAGAEPIKQALINNEKEIIITAHRLESKIDSGSTLNTISYPVNYKKEQTFEENIQRLRDQITPLFSRLLDKTLKNLED